LNSTFARLDAAFAQQKQFASDAAHELRTPVSVMLTQTQTALNRERDRRDYRETVEACQRAAQRMRKLIESLLALARLDAGQEQMKRLILIFPEPCAIASIGDSPACRRARRENFTELHRLEITGDSEAARAGRHESFDQRDSIQPADGEVRVKLESQDGMAVLTVSDTGHGNSGGRFAARV
jgi:two-component system, OmpR family, sensor kinase